MVAFSELVKDKVLTFNDGYRTKKSELSSSGFQLIRAADVQAGWITFDGTDYVDAEYVKAIGHKAAEENDLVMTTKGTVGRIAVVPGLNGKMAVYSPQICFFRVTDQDILNPEYLRYWFHSPAGTRQIEIYSGNTDMAPYLSLKDIGSFEFELPAKGDQDAIAQVLGALDDKIAANRKLIRMLNCLAKVELEREICQTSVDWVTVGEIAEFHNRRRIPLSKNERESRRGNIPYYGATGVVDYVDEALFDEPLTLVGEDGTVAKADGTAVVQYVIGPVWVNNHAHVLTGKLVSTELLRLLLDRTHVSDRVTGAVQPKLSMGNLKSVTLDVPRGSGLEHIESRIAEFTVREMAANQENVKLAATRDELLPLLMSGKITVKDAEQRVEREV